MARWRHLLVAIGVVPAMIIYVGLIIGLAALFTNIHPVLDLLFYIAAGLLWIPPAGKVITWLAKHEAE